MIEVRRIRYLVSIQDLEKKLVQMSDERVAILSNMINLIIIFVLVHNGAQIYFCCKKSEESWFTLDSYSY